MLPGVSLLQSNCRIVWSLISQEINNWYLTFLHGVSHQKKVAAEQLRLPLLVWCGQLCLPSNQIARFFDKQNLSRETFDIFDILHGARLKEGSMYDCHCWLGEARFASGIIGSHDSLIMNIARRSKLISLSRHFHLIVLFYFLASFIKLSRFHLVMTCLCVQLST